MSHFTVLVIGSKPDDQMAPFQENNMGDCPRQYLKFYDNEDEYLDEWNNKKQEMIKFPDGSLKFTWDDSVKKYLKEHVKKALPNPDSDPTMETAHEEDDQDAQLESAGLEKVTVGFGEIYSSFEEFMEDWAGFSSRDSETGRYGYWDNPNKKWDWYQLGGRWTGFFKLKDFGNDPVAVLDDRARDRILKTFRLAQGGVGGEKSNAFRQLFALMYKYSVSVTDDERIVIVDRDEVGNMLAMAGTPGLGAGHADNGYVDCAPKYLIDFDGMREEAAKKAHEEYDKFESAVADVELPTVTWNEFRDSKTAEGVSIDDIRAEWNNTPWRKALNEARIWMMGDEIEYYCVTTGGRKTFIENAKKRAIATYAVLKDGKWIQRGEMGWFGMASDEMEFGDWFDKYKELLDSLPDDTLLSVYDCHI